MNNLISFFRSKHPEFVPLALTEIPTNKIFIEIDGKLREFVFFNMLYEPQLIGVETGNRDVDFRGVSNMLIEDGVEIPIIKFSVNFERIIAAGDKNVVVFSVREVTLKANFLERWYANRFFKRAIIKNNFIIKALDANVYRKIIAFFYYPKPVYIVSTTAVAGKNAFPVDTCKQVGNHFIFGVRRSNTIINSLKTGDVIAIGLSDFSKRHLIYELGKYIPEESLIRFNTDEKFSIAVPEIVVTNHFITLTEIIRYDHQDVYVGEIIESETTLESAAFFAHVHKFWLLSARRRKLLFQSKTISLKEQY